LIMNRFSCNIQFRFNRIAVQFINSTNLLSFKRALDGVFVYLCFQIDCSWQRNNRRISRRICLWCLIHNWNWSKCYYCCCENCGYCSNCLICYNRSNVDNIWRDLANCLVCYCCCAIALHWIHYSRCDCWIICWCLVTRCWGARAACRRHDGRRARVTCTEIAWIGLVVQNAVSSCWIAWSSRRIGGLSVIVSTLSSNGLVSWYGWISLGGVRHRWVSSGWVRWPDCLSAISCSRIGAWCLISRSSSIICRGISLNCRCISRRIGGFRTIGSTWSGIDLRSEVVVCWRIISCGIRIICCGWWCLISWCSWISLGGVRHGWVSIGWVCWLDCLSAIRWIWIGAWCLVSRSSTITKRGISLNCIVREAARVSLIRLSYIICCLIGLSCIGRNYRACRWRICWILNFIRICLGIIKLACNIARQFNGW
jgi:hypothetical protein